VIHLLKYISFSFCISNPISSLTSLTAAFKYLVLLYFLIFEDSSSSLSTFPPGKAQKPPATFKFIFLWIRSISNLFFSRMKMTVEAYFTS